MSKWRQVETATIEVGDDVRTISYAPRRGEHRPWTKLKHWAEVEHPDEIVEIKLTLEWVES